MREKDIEKQLQKRVKETGGMALKFNSSNVNGVPDRIILFPFGRMAFVELKAPGQRPRPLQKKRIRQLQETGFLVYVIDSHEGVEELLRDFGRV